VTRQEFTDAVAEVLGIHAMEYRVETIVLLADKYAATQAGPAIPSAARERLKPS
jgi:hypothetical protein